MSDILLLVPPDRQVSRAIDAALDLAAQRTSGVLAVAVVDADASERLTNRMIDVGLLAERITEQVSDALAREHHVRGEALLADIADRARARAIPCRTAIEAGDVDEVARRIVEREHVAAAVLVTEKRSWLSRLVSGTEPLHPPILGGCEVLLVEED